MELLFSLFAEILVPIASVVLEVLLALLGETFGWILEGLFEWLVAGRREAPATVTTKPSPDADGVPLVDRTSQTRGILPGLLFNATLGLLLGIGSILVLPSHLITSPLLRLVAIPVGAVACGLIVPRVGRLLRGDRPARSLAIDGFADAFVFALAFSLMRYFGAR